MRKKSKSKIKMLLKVSLLSLAIILFSLFTFISIQYIKTPLDVEALSSTNLGVEIYSTDIASSSPIYYSKDKKVVSNSSLNEHTLNAFISIEDKRFYEHNGYDLKRMIKAGLVNLKSGSKSQGASTITQQLVKNILLNSEKTYSRKFKEVLLSVKTEKNFSKDQILNMYLNSIYFGSNAYGIESASNLYFDKPACDLTINESAILAGIIKSPAYYSPINHPENCFNRKNIVLHQMYNNGYISLEELNQNLKLNVSTNYKRNNYDNSYNQQVIIEACKVLNISEKELLRKELKIYTYLDNELQQKLEDNIINLDVEADKVSMVADSSGHVLAYFGDSYFDLSTMKRNPASTIKPLIVYLPAIANNILSPASPLLDEKLDKEYSPRNAGDVYHGWISTREALAHSSNVCAVNVLNQIGIDNALKYAKLLGLEISNSDESIALGNIGGGTTILELAHAYSILQNNGLERKMAFISKIEDQEGKILYRNDDHTMQVLKEEDCMLINDMLKTCVTDGTAKRLSDLSFEVAGKTGTAQVNGKHSDLWNVAYTTEHLAITWIGDATSKGLEIDYSSGFYPTIINKKILSTIYSSHSPTNFSLSNNIHNIAIDAIEYDNSHIISLATDDAPERYKRYELFKVDNIPTNLSSTYAQPKFNLDVKLGAKGANISMDYNPAYTYQIFSKSNNTITLVGPYCGSPIYDDKVYQYSEVEYYVVATNNYTKTRYSSPKIQLKPEEYLVDMLNNSFISQQSTKKKWYV